jgi:hypothetical protein
MARILDFVSALFDLSSSLNERLTGLNLIHAAKYLLCAGEHILHRHATGFFKFGHGGKIGHYVLQ